MTTFYSQNRPLGTQTTTNQSSLPGQQSSIQQQQQTQQNNLYQQSNYDFSPLANQVYPYNGSNPSSNGSNGLASAVSVGSNGSNGNGYIYNNSPLNNNATLSQPSSSAYNNLNLSIRSTGQGVYPTPRASNSPNLNFASLYSSRARFHASKGFDLEDDLEFCPEIHEHHAVQHHRFNPYTSHTFSPKNSPSTIAVDTTSPITRKDYTTTNESPKNITPRAKKVLEIVNPATGLRVSSPAPYK
ncbi:hypothetical protein BN7_3995 [Wickerhamomyces ciferrii]|uniref:Uncharacterized protein n=1 Tax=Wickerhamomyces ciferrii (strain ATCC 14091 / BCRC 22168 / CBS 111 / JCM 3599 / NBRC 0793 / NRRL Y-1031 F-60-10) TaxID=1206466 RepID=K0KN67_WICCF|nr:uncharacterized protein BN7_3995 [Wickerhamomyces ciferrii]CCH44431.1 hypothetical protein BN7_3995 [Wickerhamomyces ciferrii]